MCHGDPHSIHFHSMSMCEEALATIKSEAPSPMHPALIPALSRTLTPVTMPQLAKGGSMMYERGSCWILWNPTFNSKNAQTRDRWLLGHSRTQVWRLGPCRPMLTHWHLCGPFQLRANRGTSGINFQLKPSLPPCSKVVANYYSFIIHKNKLSLLFFHIMFSYVFPVWDGLFPWHLIACPATLQDLRIHLVAFTSWGW